MRNCCCCNPSASDVYSNSATMVDGAGNPGFPATLQPYDQCGEGSTGGCGIPSPRNCGGADQPPCGSSGGPSVIGNNNYSPTGDKQTFTGPCRKTGWKNVQARATWPGIFGFVNSGVDCCPTDAPPQFKYTKIKETILGNFTYKRISIYSFLNWDETYSHDYEQISTVSDIGNITRTGRVNWFHEWTNENGTFGPGNQNCGGATGAGYDWAEGGQGVIVDQPLWDFWAICGNITFQTAGGNYYNGTADELNALNLYPPITPSPPNSNSTGHGAVFTCSDNKITVKWESSFTYDDGAGTTIFSSSSFEKTIELIGSYSYANVQEEIAALLSQWSLADDAVYPWRTDGKTWKAPLVSRDAGSVGPSLDWTVDGSCNFNQSTPYSGAILGGPNPAGYARYWDYRAKITEPCCPEGLIIRDNNWFCTPGWGEYSTSPIPASATQWTNNEDGSLMMEGAWLLQWNGADYIWAQKWAESLEEWPSVNYARPFGRDRFLVDYSNVTGIAECYGTTGIPTADYIGDIVTDSGDPLYAFRRFPSCRPIGSTIIISLATQSSPGFVTITTAESHWLLPGDSLDFYGVSGLATNVAVASATPGTNTFTVAGTLIGAYTGGGYVASHYTAFDTWKWDWTCSRHTFVVQQWQTDYRGSGSVLYNQYQASLQLAAKTSVIYFSPNTESFSNGYLAGFGSIAYEPCYDKSQWHGKFLQATVDPFFKAPLQCSGDTGTEHFCQQSAPCATDTDPTCVYYQYPPLVEPMIVPPEGSPPLPVSFPSFDGGMPGKAGVNCANPKDIPTIHAIRQAWLDCHDWETVVHKHCISSVNPSTISASRGAGNSIGAGGGSTGL